MGKQNHVAPPARFLSRGLWLGLGLSLLSPVAGASIVALPCPRCSPAQFEQAALQKGIGTHHFYDFTNGVIKKFLVYQERDTVPGSILTFAEEEPVSANYQAYFEKMLQVRRELGDLSKILVDIPVNPGDPIAGNNAFDVVRQSAIRNDVSNWLSSGVNNLLQRVGLPNSTVGNLGGLLQALDKIFTSGELLELTVVLTFTDGSQVVYEFSVDGPVDGRAEYVEDTARDANGNRIPELGEGPRLGEIFRLDRVDGNDDAQAFLDFMCTQVRCSSTHYASLIVTCTWDGHELSCATKP